MYFSTGFQIYLILDHLLETSRTWLLHIVHSARVHVRTLDTDDKKKEVQMAVRK